MVVGLVLEHQQPVLLFAVYLGVHVDGAGVDLLTLVQFGKQAPLFQGFCADGGNVHQGLRTLRRLFLAVDLHTGCKVLLVGCLYGGVFNVNVV